MSYYFKKYLEECLEYNKCSIDVCYYPEAILEIGCLGFKLALHLYIEDDKEVYIPHRVVLRVKSKIIVQRLAKQKVFHE